MLLGRSGKYNSNLEVLNTRATMVGKTCKWLLFSFAYIYGWSGNLDSCTYPRFSKNAVICSACGGSD